jgi:hypothetical protein
MQTENVERRTPNVGTSNEEPPPPRLSYFDVQRSTFDVFLLIRRL